MFAGSELSQAELIRRAFAGDDVQADFEANKAAEVEEELPKQASLALCLQPVPVHPEHVVVCN